jgi:xyloglucan-specific exo-beta-1,4-glucanase
MGLFNGVKKIIKLSLVLLVTVFLTGCSLDGVSPKKVVKATGSIWKSIDGGKTWAVKNVVASNAKAAIADADILSIAINPYDSNNILFGTRSNGIIKTVDGGETLDATNFISEKVYGLAFDPADGRVIYASGVWQKRGKIWKSTDSGENWTEIFTAASEGPLVINLNVDKKNSKIVYASTSDNQVIKSADAGASWKNIFQAPAPVLQTTIDSSNSNLVYFNVQRSGIYRSREGGTKAEDITKEISKISNNNNDFNLVETDPNNAGWIYAVGLAGILRSKDGGNSWEKIETLDDPQTFPVKSVAVKPGNSNELVYGAASAVYKSDNQGINWMPFQLADPKPIRVLKYSSTDPQMVYLGTSK